MLVIISCLLLLFYWVKVSRINPGKYPQAEPAVVASWQGMQLIYCRRFTGMLLIWIVLAIANGFLLNQAVLHDNLGWHYAYFASLAVTSAYLITAIVYIVICFVRMHKWAKAQGIAKTS